MFDVSAFLFSSPTVEELDLAWSVSAGDLGSASTTHPDDDDLPTDDDDEDGDDPNDEGSKCYDDNAPEERVRDKAIITSLPLIESQGRSRWIALGHDDSTSPPAVSNYDPDDVYCYILNGTAHANTRDVPTPFGRISSGQSTSEVNSSYEVSYEEHCRGLISHESSASRSRAASRDNDGFPMLVEEDILMDSFMQASTPRRLGASASIGTQSLEHETCVSRVDLNSTPRTSPVPTPFTEPSGSDVVATKHLRWWGHGRRWTCLALLFAWAGSALTVFTRQSFHFVTLAVPVVVASDAYEPIHQLGLFYIQLCYNETASDGLSGCQVLTLRSSDVSDNVYDAARLLGSLSTILGSFLTFFLSTSVVWETINLRPIGFGLLLTYFFQSFTMLLFDSDVCQEGQCSVGSGCLLSIGAALCWLGSCLATAAMEAHKIRATRARQRQLKRRVKCALRKAQKQMQNKEKQIMKERKDSLDTYNTNSSSSSDMSAEDLEVGNIIEVPSIETSDFEATRGPYEV
jgi:hypothetical protein